MARNIAPSPSRNPEIGERREASIDAFLLRSECPVGGRRSDRFPEPRLRRLDAIKAGRPDLIRERFREIDALNISSEAVVSRILMEENVDSGGGVSDTETHSGISAWAVKAGCIDDFANAASPYNQVYVPGVLFARLFEGEPIAMAISTVKYGDGFCADRRVFVQERVSVQSRSLRSLFWR